MALGFPGHLPAQDISADQALAAFADGVPIQPGGVTLTLADVAEDVYKVPVEVTAPGQRRF